MSSLPEDEKYCIFGGDIIIKCPNCDCYVLINRKDINCGIFRHGVFNKSSGLQGQAVPPHETKENCDKLLKEEKINGCGKPFKINANARNREEETKAEKCDYV